MGTDFSELVQAIVTGAADLSAKTQAQASAQQAADEAEAIATAKETALGTAQEETTASYETFKAAALALVDALNPKANLRRK